MLCSCGSVVEHCVSSVKVVGSFPREHMYWQKKCITCKSLWIKASAKCINVNVYIYTHTVILALTHITNTSLHTDVFPSAFRQARITPLIHKPSLNPSLLEKYRPVSLLAFIAKTHERAVFNQVSAFLTQNNLLNMGDLLGKLGCCWKRC